MKKILLISLILCSFLSIGIQQKAFATILSGNVNKEEYININKRVIDIQTGKPIANATVGIPSSGIFTKTDENGAFSLGASLKSPFILSVKAEGYKPFSAVIENNDESNSLIIGIKKQNQNEIVIDSNIRHLGDNKYSDTSANAGDFSNNSDGTYFFKEFYVDKDLNTDKISLKIGSIIGIDTKTAKKLQQSQVIVSYSSPVKIYLNSKKIGELNINGDNQTIKVPDGLLRVNAHNNIRIETGINLNATDRSDYDDIEFMNLILEFE